MPTDEEFQDSRIRIFTKYRGKSYADYFTDLRTCLDDKEVRYFIGRAAKDIQRAIDRLLTADTPKECANAANLLYHWMNDLEGWMHEQRLAYFGEWGRRFMYAAIDEASEEEIERFARQWGPLSEEKAIEVFEDDDKANAEETTGGKNQSPVTVTIVEENFAVRVGEQECILGNTKLLRLLLALAKSPNQFIGHRRIVELMGEDSLSIGSLKQTKYLLTCALRDANCGVLADAIVADIDHYGLLLNRQRLALESRRVRTQSFDQGFTEP